MGVITRSQKRKSEERMSKRVLLSSSSSSSSSSKIHPDEKARKLRDSPWSGRFIGPYGEPIRNLTDEERLRYNKQIEESDGFDVEYFGYFTTFEKLISPMFGDVNGNRKLRGLAKLALMYFKDNVEKGAKLRFVRVVKVNKSPGRYFEYYITFECKDATAPADDQIKTFQALVVLDLRRYYVDFCRRKPPPPPPSPLTIPTVTY